MSIEITKLPNQLTVATDTMTDAETVSIYVWVEIGTKHESPEKNGIAHFIEHMMFKGTSHRTAKMIAEEFDNTGGYINAYTTREYTVYYCRILKNDIARAVNIMADMLQNSTFDLEELERERSVIFQEIGQSEDTPNDIIFDHYQNLIFGNDPLGRPILGTKDTVSSISYDDLKEFTNNYYTAGNIVISAAGAVSHKEFTDIVEREFSKLRHGSFQPTTSSIYQSGDYRKNKELEQLHLILGFKGINCFDPRFTTMQVLSSILGSGMSSRLFQEVREKRGLAYTISSSPSLYRDAGVISIYAGTSPEKTNELIEAVAGEIQNISNNISDEELMRAKQQVKASILMDRESVPARAEILANNLACYGRYIAPNEWLEKYEAVTKESIADLALEIFDSSALSVTSMGNTNLVPEYSWIQERFTA